MRDCCHGTNPLPAEEQRMSFCLSIQHFAARGSGLSGQSGLFGSTDETNELDAIDQADPRTR